MSDISIVVVPKHRPEFNGEAGYVSEVLLTDKIDWKSLGRVLENHRRYKKLVLPEGIQLCLYVVLPPAQWGLVLALASGPTEFSRFIVTHTKQGGALPCGYHIMNGGIYWQDNLIVTPEEEDYLRLLGLMGNYGDPKKRF